LLDANRYNQLRNLAEAIGLNWRAPAWQWKDTVAAELNVAVMHSYAKKGVTIVDQHNASDQFMQHIQNEYQQRGGCPADWVWITPPMSGSLTKVFHQEMVNYKLKPSYEYQDKAWRTYKYESNVKLRTHFRSAVIALQWTLGCTRQMLAKRPRIRVLFASETGKSKEFAQRFASSMERLMHCEAIQMDEYDLKQLEKETHLVVICSTFGSGQPPENGEVSLNDCQSDFKVQSINCDFSVFFKSSRSIDRG
jgi:nitric-oxide synthase